MTFDFLSILIGLGATVLGLGAWCIKFSHSNEAGQKAILTLLRAISARDKMEKLQGNVEMVRPPTFLSDDREFPPILVYPPFKSWPNWPKTGSKKHPNTP